MAVLDALFALAADIEECSEMNEDHRWSVELSLWQATSELDLHTVDQQKKQFILNRRKRLEVLLAQSANNSIVCLLYSWESLLRPRTESMTILPGPFRQDAMQVTQALFEAGLPRRAKVIGNKFQVPIDPLITWNTEHRPESEEVSRTNALISKIAIPNQPIPYRVFVCERALQQVLSAPLNQVPMVVSSNGYIHIANSIYGGVTILPKRSNTTSVHAAQHSKSKRRK